MPTSQAPLRAAPPPFSRQRTRSRLVLVCLVLAVAGVLAVGTLVTLPTHVTAPATLPDAAACGGSGTTAGAPGCVVVRLDPRWSDRLPASVPGRLLLADGESRTVELSRTASGRDGPVLAARLDEVPPPGPLTVVADVGRRRLALVFLGRGLEAHP